MEPTCLHCILNNNTTISNDIDQQQWQNTFQEQVLLKCDNNLDTNMCQVLPSTTCKLPEAVLLFDKVKTLK